MEWLDINKKKPQCNMREGSIGVEVFVEHEDFETAFYGRRYGGLPCFYKRGEKLAGITKWAPLDGPENDIDPTEFVENE